MGRRSDDREKITLTLPRELLRYVDKRAAELATTRSQLIGEVLAEWRARGRDDLAREGYAFYAREAEEFAALSMNSVSEALGSGAAR